MIRKVPAMVAFMHTGTRLTAGYRYTTLWDATGDKPQQCEPPGQSAPCYPETCGEMVCGFAGKDPVDKDFKVPNLAGVRPGIN